MSCRHGFHGSSASSGDAESVNGTPETRLTPFSSVKSVNDKTGFLFHSSPAVSASAKGSTTQHGLGSLDKDPFVSSSTKAKYEQSLLSPTASSFQPFSLRISQGIYHSPMVVESPIPSGAVRITKQPMEPLASVESEDPVSPAGSQNSAITQSGTFSTDLGSVSRALKVSGLYDPVVPLHQVQAFVQKTCGNAAGSLKFVRFGGDVLVRFSDITDAIKTYNHAKSAQLKWSVDFITPATFAEKLNPKSPFVSAHEGQVSLVANFPASGGFDRVKLEGVILDLLRVDGAVYAYQKQFATEAGTFRLVAEYSNVNSAARAVERLNGATVRGINISIAFHKPDVTISPRRRGQAGTPTRTQLNNHELSGALAQMPVATPATMNRSMVSSGYASILSPTGRSFVPTQYELSPMYSTVPVAFGDQFSHLSTALIGYNSPALHCAPAYPGNHFGANSPSHPGIAPQMGGWNGFGSSSPGPPRGSPLARFSARRQNPPRGGNRSTYANSQVGQHNVVDIDRIRGGLDVRTTIMLRNIPNKIDQAQLKAIVDQTSRGLYDFMYLRIDFANNCNVGYAFINFEDPYHIISFVAARAGQRWNRYSSDKIAEVSYATIQGKDCLVQKFRNSSVMLEHPSFRPKIFFTGNHPRAGEEEDFPLPDNASKMRRSVENAEHVGLFAPRAGQHYRDEQRRRRSRYDRGTRLAALEEYDYEDYYHIDQEFQGSSPY